MMDPHNSDNNSPSTVTVRHLGSAFKFRLGKNRILSHKQLRNFFKKDVALIYREEEDMFSVDVDENNDFIISENTVEVEVYSLDDPGISRSGAKSERIKDIMATIISTRVTGPTKTDMSSSNVSTKSQKSLNKAKKLEKTPYVKFNVGWLHKQPSGLKFTQMKGPVGGRKELMLDPEIEYSVEDITKLIADSFSGDSAQALIRNSHLQLGNFREEMISSFKTEENNLGNFWTYRKTQKTIPSRSPMYLYTTGKSESSPKPPQKSTITNKRSAQHVVSLDPAENVIMNKKSKLTDSLLQDDIVLPPPANPLDTPVSHFDTRSLTSLLENFEDDDVNLEDVIEILGSDDIDPPADTHDGNNGSSESTMSSRPFSVRNKPDPRDIPDVEVLYRLNTFSRYSNKLSTMELSRRRLYEECQPNVHTRVFDEYDPLHDGHEICCVKMDCFEFDKTRFYVDVNQTGPLGNHTFEKIYKFPDCDLSSKAFHTILHDTHELHGYCDGKFGIGVIPYCSDKCKPFFRWYCNDQLVASGRFLCWLPISDDESSSWWCQITCNGQDPSLCQGGQEEVIIKPDEDRGGLNVFSTSTGVSSPERPKEPESEMAASQEAVHELEDYSENILPTLFTISLIPRSDFTVGPLIGCGTQSKVFRGEYSGTPVAIKEIKMQSKDIKFTSRELGIIDIVRHPNIVPTMGFCINYNKLYIIMEMIDGNSLWDILTDDEIKMKYSLSIESKHQIVLELCRAVNYLHKLPTPIIHRDIKPENVLVTQDGHVKLCDLGLSFFETMATALTTTLGHNSLKGSKMYLAPELWLSGQRANICSDVWALGCSIIEIYSEKPVWNLDASNQEEHLRCILKECTIPSVSDVPAPLQNMMEKCFMYDPSKRPSVADILSVLYSVSN